jgi:hypothetical protein
MERLYKFLGLALIGSGIIFNEWMIRFLSSGQVRFAEPEKRYLLIALEAILILLGFFIYLYKKNALQNMLLLLCSVLFALGMLEVGLRFVPTTLESEAPLWIPYEHKRVNARIQEKHLQQSKGNRHGFNDREHAFRAAPGVTRIAVLGDSFVWGDGVESSVIWTNKLARLLTEKGIAAEVLNWGKSGWSTLHEFRFLKTEGIHYDFDLLLVGFVVNDPVMNESQAKRFIYPGGVVDRLIVEPLSRHLFPNAVSFTVDLINAFCDSYLGYGYVHWLNKVYSEENLLKYQALLKTFSEYCRSRHIRMIFVMTPENHSTMLQERFERIIPLLKRADIDYVNLYPDVYRELHHLPNRSLWANPADGHPGDQVTDIYARCVYEHLLKRGYLKSTGTRKT